MQQQQQAQQQQQQQQGAAAAAVVVQPAQPAGAFPRAPVAAAGGGDGGGGGGGGFNLPPAAPTGQPVLTRQASDELLQLREELVRIQQLSDAGLHPSQLAVARQTRAAGQPEAVPERPPLRRTASLEPLSAGLARPVPLKRFGSARQIIERGADEDALRAGTGLTMNAVGAAAQLMSRLNALAIPNVDPPRAIARAAAANELSRASNQIQAQILKREVARVRSVLAAGLAQNAEKIDEADAAAARRAAEQQRQLALLMQKMLERQQRDEERERKAQEERAAARAAAAAEAAAADQSRTQHAAQAGQERTQHAAQAGQERTQHAAHADQSRAGHAAARDQQFAAASVQRSKFHNVAITLAKDQHAQTMAAFTNLGNRLLGRQICNWGDWFRGLAARAGDFRVRGGEPEWMEPARNTYSARNFTYCLANLLLWTANGMVWWGVAGVSVLVITPGRMAGQLTSALWGIPIIGTGSYIFAFIIGSIVAMWVEATVAAAILTFLGIPATALGIMNAVGDAFLSLCTFFMTLLEDIFAVARATPGLWAILRRWWHIIAYVFRLCWVQANFIHLAARGMCYITNPFGRQACLDAVDQQLAVDLQACKDRAEAPATVGGGRRTRRRRRRRQQRGGAPYPMQGWTMDDVAKKAKLFLKNMEKNDPARVRFAKEMVNGMKSSLAQAIREKWNTERASNMVSTIIGNIFNFSLTRSRPAQEEPLGDLRWTMNTMIKISGGLVVNYNKMLTPGGGGTSFLDEMSKINFDTELQSWSQLPKLENKWPEFADLTGTIIQNTRSLERINVVVATLSRGLRMHALSAGAQKDIQEARAAGEATFHDVPDGTAHVFDGGEPEREPVLPKGATAKIHRWRERERAAARRHMMKPSRTKGGGNRRKKTKRRGRKRIKKRKTRHKGKRKRTRRRGGRRARRRHTRR